MFILFSVDDFHHGEEWLRGERPQRKNGNMDLHWSLECLPAFPFLSSNRSEERERETKRQMKWGWSEHWWHHYSSRIFFKSQMKMWGEREETIVSLGHCEMGEESMKWMSSSSSSKWEGSSTEIGEDLTKQRRLSSRFVMPIVNWSMIRMNDERDPMENRWGFIRCQARWRQSSGKNCRKRRDDSVIFYCWNRWEGDVRWKYSNETNSMNNEMLKKRIFSRRKFLDDRKIFFDFWTDRWKVKKGFFSNVSFLRVTFSLTETNERIG